MARTTTAERGREVRRRLLASACELIAERGWTAVSTRMLAERAGVAPGLVHYHFASVHALLSEAAVGAMRDHLSRMPESLDGADDARQVLDGLLAELEETTGLDPESLLFIEAYLAATRDDALRREISAVVAEFRTRLEELLLRHGVAAPERTAAVLTAAVDGVLLHRALTPGLSGAALAPVLGRLLAPAPGGGTDDDTEGGGDRR
ncbi:TetR/AcrR family transcriptional regulator [Streptomonospora litoralis]|uniref:Transcriptional regulator BetI n=1 Tax=Streptomonospora litoralis TaxID=2498135 RepID=A0A4P6Q826_9ACTN|nr:TetR/AcrR family transcriptional regulator [Streptomonospora litoralis]QBI55174.1 transcriptional regulator BetI [Streptomonospora litoralis]